MKRAVLKNNAGFTLIELIVVSALMILVITVAYSLFSFGNKLFSISSNQYDAQSEVRIAMDSITNKIRFATQVEIVNADDVSSFAQQAAGYSYYYMKDGKLYHSIYDKTSDNHNIVMYGGYFSSDASLFSRFNPTTLNIKIYSLDGTQSYTGETKIDLLNVKNTITGNSSGSGLKYKANT